MDLYKNGWALFQQLSYSFKKEGRILSREHMCHYTLLQFHTNTWVRKGSIKANLIQEVSSAIALHNKMVSASFQIFRFPDCLTMQSDNGRACIMVASFGLWRKLKIDVECGSFRLAGSVKQPPWPKHGMSMVTSHVIVRKGDLLSMLEEWMKPLLPLWKTVAMPMLLGCLIVIGTITTPSQYNYSNNEGSNFRF